MMQPQDVARVLSDPLAQELMQSSIPARLAYLGPDGFPRAIPIGFRNFYDSLSHEWTLKFVEHRVADRRMLHLIRKWMKAGASEDGQ